MKDKLYFNNEGSCICCPLEDHINEAKEEGLAEIELIEAIPAPNEDQVWCTYYGDVVERNECKKSECEHYSSKSGRGVCENRGNYFLHGEKVKFDLKDIEP